MDQTPLVSRLRIGAPEIEAGTRLVDALEREGDSVSAAFWYYATQPDTYRLVIATDLIDQVGPLRAYQRVQHCLAALAPTTSLTLAAVAVVSPNAPVVQRVRMGGLPFADERACIDPGSCVEGSCT